MVHCQKTSWRLMNLFTIIYRGFFCPKGRRLVRNTFLFSYAIILYYRRIFGIAENHTLFPYCRYRVLFPEKSFDENALLRFDNRPKSISDKTLRNINDFRQNRSTSPPSPMRRLWFTGDGLQFTWNYVSTRGASIQCVRRENTNVQKRKLVLSENRDFSRLYTACMNYCDK